MSSYATVDGRTSATTSVVKAEPDEEDEALMMETLEDVLQMDVDDDDNGDEEVYDDVDEDEEEIIREMDVFISPELASQLYLLQFPLQHRSVPLPEAARLKPGYGMLELDHGLPPNIGQDGAFSLYRRTHASHTIPVSTHMAIGLLHVSAVDPASTTLHLVPLSHILQMRPGFEHVDELTNPSDDAEIDNLRDDENSKLEKKPVMFQKKESERAAIARKSSYAYKRACEDSEEWQVLNVLGPESIEYEKQKSGMLCPSPQTELVSTIELPKNEKDGSTAFVHSLNYLPATEDASDPTFAESGVAPPLTQVCAQLTTLLQRGWPVPYSVVRPQFPSSIDDHDLLMALASCSVLVRGNFVLQSRLLSLPPAMIQARTFVLFLFQILGYVQRVRLEYVYDGDGTVTPEVLLMILEQVASKTLNGWKLKLEDDPDFCDNFPEQTQLHLQYWERQAKRFAAQLERYRDAPVQ